MLPAKPSIEEKIVITKDEEIDVISYATLLIEMRQ